MLKINFYSIVPFIVTFLSLHTVSAAGLAEQANLLQAYPNVGIDTLFGVIRNDFLSEDLLLQDAGCILLHKAFKRLKSDDRKAVSLFARLSGDEKAVFGAAGIIDSRLLGWYNGEPADVDDKDFEIYTPLFHLLGKTESKTARGTLVRSLLYLRGRKDIFDRIPMNENLVALSIKRLDVIRQRLCCSYPGKDFVTAMLEKDLRSTMLDAFADMLKVDKTPDGGAIDEIRRFALDCMEYGDAKNGEAIRIRAVELAGMLVRNDGVDVARKIESLSNNDPYYVHAYNDSTGYSMTELRYPVREACLKFIQSR